MFYIIKLLQNLYVDFYIRIIKIYEGKREKLMLKSDIKNDYYFKIK